MPVLIGVDEAGYGPNYGPLCVAASAWRVAENEKESGGRHQESRVAAHGAAAGAVCRSRKRAAGLVPAEAGFPDLYKLLRKAVARTPDKAGKKLAIADSKALYSPAGGIKQLERGVLAALLAIDDDASLSAAAPGTEAPPVGARSCVNRVSELLAATGADPHVRRTELACHHGDEQTLPVESAADEICRLAALLRKTCAEKGAALLTLRARLVYPAEFNELVDHFGSKGAALSHVTLQLVREVVDGVTVAAASGSARESAFTNSSPDETQGASRAEPGVMRDRLLICLDKHGGRNHYAALVQHHFPDSWIEPVSENRSRSCYRWTHEGAPIEAVFRIGGEEWLPTALASMTAKYHRELAMRAFNAFWTERLPELRPTAGYPQDAHRFKAAIAGVQSELGIEDWMVWRNR